MRLLTEERSAGAPRAVSPAGSSFDPFAPAYVADPYPQLASLRSSEPVFHSPAIDSWIVTRHATILAVLRDTARFSASIVSDPLTPLCPAARGIIAGSEFDVPPMLVNNDPPSHPRYRRIFGEPLKPQALRSLGPFIEAVVERHLDLMIAAGPPADLVTALTWDVPALVLFKLLGVPDEDVAFVKAYADSRVALLWGRPSEAEQIRLSQGALDFFRYTQALVDQRLQSPRDDYPSDVIRLRGGDDSKVSIREIVGTTFNLLFAGHETTSSAAANTFLAVLRQPGMWQRIAAGTLAVGKVVEEGLRYDPPVQAWRRRAKDDVVLDGIDIAAGSHLLLVFAAANRDPERFAEPDRFDPERDDVQGHLAFGVGAHFCLGAPLARLEIAGMIAQTARRLPTLRLEPQQTAAYVPNTSFRGVRRLMVSW